MEEQHFPSSTSRCGLSSGKKILWWQSQTLNRGTAPSCSMEWEGFGIGAGTLWQQWDGEVTPWRRWTLGIASLGIQGVLGSACIGLSGAELGTSGDAGLAEGPLSRR